MTKTEQKQLASLVEEQSNALSRQGKAKTTIDLYTRPLRRISAYFDCCPDQLSLAQLKDYFTSLVKSHSWSTVKLDRNGLQFFYKHVLNKKWVWVDIVKPPKQIVLPDIFTLREIENLINNTRELRYKTFILVAFSMGLRLGEVLNLQIGDIDGGRMQLHIRQGKGKKDRYVLMPQRAYIAIREYWATHRHPKFIFPNGKSSEVRKLATKVMDRGGLQKSFKAIVKDCGIHKTVSIHTLRHSYGASLVEIGIHLRTIQHEMGHECPKTTALYTQLTEGTYQNTRALINAMLNKLRLVFDGEV